MKNLANTGGVSSLPLRLHFMHGVSWFPCDLPGFSSQSRQVTKKHQVFKFFFFRFLGVFEA